MPKIIVTAALTGAIYTPTMSPYLPVTPEQLIEEALAVHKAGGAICHLHVRDPLNGKPVGDVALFRKIATEVKKRCDVILCFTTGGGLGMTTAERVKPVTVLKPEMASFNAGSVNFCLAPALKKIKDWKYDWEKPYLESSLDFVYPNTFKTMTEYGRYFQESGTKPEYEVFDTAMINNIAFLIAEGVLAKPVYFEFVFGILGGIQSAPRNLMFLIDAAQREIGDFQFSVCAAGRHQFNMCTQSLLLGGHVRVGLEDSTYLKKGVLAKSNAEQVQKIIRIAAELGLDPATPDEAREILGLKGLDKVGF